jgi:8-oxo-dGTP pyrophosphatase MutT (NUDIX family)
MSYGIICMKRETKELLMICRRYSFSYTEFIRGKYDMLDIGYIKKLIENMSKEEYDIIKNTNNFKMLWNKLWNIKRDQLTNKINRSFFYKSIIKYNILKNGFYHEEDKKYYKLSNILEETKPKYDSPEWFFPKGRRDDGEDDIEVAKREFVEETDIQMEDILLNENRTVEEIHKGTNGIMYKTIFFLADYTGKKKNIDISNKHQLIEIGDIKWINISDIKDIFRDYEHEKIDLVNRMKKIF